MREKNILKSSLQINLSHKYSLVGLEPSGTVAQLSWPSGHLGHLEHPGNIQGSTNTSGMTLWHTGTLLAWLACWHSRQTHGTGKPMMTHHSLTLDKTLMAHTDDVVSLWLMMVYMVMILMIFLS